MIVSHIIGSINPTSLLSQEVRERTPAEAQAYIRALEARVAGRRESIGLNRTARGGDESGAASLSGAAGRGLWASGPSRRGAVPARRGPGGLGRGRAVLLRSRTASPAGGVESVTSAPGCGRRRKLFSASPRHRPRAAGQSLGRLWRQQGKRTEAPHLLAEVYGWFTEGFDTVDLQEAHALLKAWGE